MKEEQYGVLDKVRCRQIVREILDFGVTQDQVRTIINSLALELEDRDLMLKINGLLSAGIEVEDKPQITI